ncbi:MAG: hypothetical protein Q9191_006193 [Dirinaria sp. TL-2023a]
MEPLGKSQSPGRDSAEPQGPASSKSTTAANDLSLALENPRHREFQSQIYKIIVGPAEEVFTAHCDTLSRSKVLSAQCSGGFEEGHSKIISLKDSDPEIFASVLEYMYRGDYWPMKRSEFSGSRSDDKDVRATQMRREADIYCMADYYALPGLQELAVQKMQMLTPLPLGSFLDVSEYIYDHSGPRGPFRDYFREQMRKFQRTEAIRPWIDRKENLPTEFAKDLFLPNVRESLPDTEVMVEWPFTRKAHVEDHAFPAWSFGQRYDQWSKKGKLANKWGNDAFEEPAEAETEPAETVVHEIWGRRVG